MQSVFTLVASTGLAYFLLAKRQFDLFSLAFFSAAVYFLPGFFGYVLYPSYTTIFEPMKLLDEAYLVMISVLFAILSGAYIFDSMIPDRTFRVTVRGTRLAVVFAAGLALLGFAMSVVTTGTALLDFDKPTMMAELNRWHILWVTSASLGAVLAFSHRTWGLFSACMGLLFIDLYIGFRMSFALTCIAIITLLLGRRGKQRLLMQNWNIVPPVVLFIFGMFFMAHLSSPIKRGDFGLIWDLLLNPDFYLAAFTTSEPFITQAILNGVIQNDFRVGMDHFSGLLYQLIFMSPELGAKVTSFNDMFQPVLFPESRAGMANNIWAEMWSSGGWPLLILFELIFIFFLLVGCTLLRVKDLTLSAGVAILGSYLAFYIHRNDLAYQVTLEKRILVVLFICIVASALVTEAVRGAKRQSP